MSFVFVGERLAINLLNTVVVQEGRVRDLVKSWRDVVAWGAAVGVLPHGELRGNAAAHEPERLRRFREVLRQGLAAWRESEAIPPRLIVLLNRQLARDPELSEVAVSRGKIITRQRSAGAPLDQVYAAVARSAAELLADGDPRRLRKCANPSCRLMFYDVSKAGRRRWCSMRMCGGRAKVRAFYRRRRPAQRRIGRRLEERER